MDYYKELIKTNIIKFINKTKMLNNYYLGIGTIFLLHRVHPFENNRLAANEGLKVSPEFLEQFILDLKKNNYTFISLNELYTILKNGKKLEKQIVFTLDDGYFDNYKIAYPIFKKYNVPFSVYVTTSFPDQKAIQWWHILEDLIVKNEKIVLSDDREYNCKTKEEKNDTFMKIRELILSFKKDNFLDNLNKLFENYHIDWFDRSKKMSMSWKEITELSRDELVTIGGHTVNHLAFNQLSEDEIINEIVEANRIIESKINKKIEHFAYPFGSRSEVMKREFNIIKKLNFKTTTTTREGNIFLEHINHLECLPRTTLCENFRLDDLGKIRRKKVVTI